jgi:transcriptional regulator with XRE-family HTH domain
VSGELRFDGMFMGLIRKRAQMTFQELARRSGTSRGHVCDLEHGNSDPSFSLAVRISEVLGVNIRYFVLSVPGRPRPPRRRPPAPEP